MSLMVSVDVKHYWTMLTHWSQLVPNSYVNRHPRTLSNTTATADSWTGQGEWQLFSSSRQHLSGCTSACLTFVTGSRHYQLRSFNSHLLKSSCPAKHASTCMRLYFAWSDVTWCTVVWCTQKAPRRQQFHVAPHSAVSTPLRCIFKTHCKKLVTYSESRAKDAQWFSARAESSVI